MATQTTYYFINKFIVKPDVLYKFVILWPPRQLIILLTSCIVKPDVLYKFVILWPPRQLIILLTSL